MNGREGFVAGGLTFIAVSYLLHCKFNAPPWQCQKADCRHKGNTGRKRKTKRRKKRKLVP